MKVVCIIQARMGSTRLPGKVMMKLADKTVLHHVIERVRLAKSVDEIVVATTSRESDNPIAIECSNIGVSCFRGSEEDVLSRYYYAAKNHQADVVIRITSDCPLIDPNVIDAMVAVYKSGQYDVVSNAGSNLAERTFPRGLDAEIFSFDLLKKAQFGSTKDYQREHVTPFLYESCDNILYFKNHQDFSIHRWTLDTKEDFELIHAIYGHLYKGSHDFFMKNILELLDQHPYLMKINEHIEQKSIK